MIVDPGSMVCVDFAARTRGITVGFTWRWSTQKPVSIKSGEDHNYIYLHVFGIFRCQRQFDNDGIHIPMQWNSRRRIINWLGPSAVNFDVIFVHVCLVRRESGEADRV
jgi:hypothetical protein